MPEVFDQILSDMKQAYDLLPATPAQRGRITKWAAAHYLAKIYLFRASEANNSWNSSTKAADLDNVIKYGTEVINVSGHKLAANFSDLWNYTAPNSANETNAEIILSAQFSTMLLPRAVMEIKRIYIIRRFTRTWPVWCATLLVEESFSACVQPTMPWMYMTA